VDVSPQGYGTIKLGQSAIPAYPSAHDFDNGTIVQLEAIPNPGYVFTSWRGAVSGTANPVTTIMDCDKRITANFSEEGSTGFRWPLGVWTTASFALAALLVTILIIRRKII
jgi:hypothetical protein